MKDTNMEKIKVKVDVFHEIDYKKPLTFARIKDIVQDDDEIHAGFNEGFYSENDSMDGHFFMNVIRERLETDEEFEKRKHNNELQNKWAKERRLESYKRLKKEFEPDETTQPDKNPE